jgi:AmmeMemoRadiSam system protein A
MTDFTAEYSAEERRWLLRLAHRSIRLAVTGKALDATPQSTQKSTQASPHLRELRGAFTTLHANGALRGCIGFVMAVEPLEQTIRETAKSAALEDPRFPPVTEAELESLQLEISVLSPMFEIAPEDVVVGRHGLMVSYRGRRGLLLPQVAAEWGWDRETLLEQTCRKAGLAPDVLKQGAKLEAFTAEVFGEAEAGESLRD